jgi:hypothetical protein
VYYYWVSCENLQQLESTLTAAQSGAVQSGTIAYMGVYSGSVTYYPGASVTYSGQFYTCILQSTGNLPTNVTYWQSTGSSSADTFLGAWNSGTAYVPGNQVTYSGGYYISILSGTNQQPDVSPTYWQIVGSVSTYIFFGAYNGGTGYVVGNQVTYLGNYWICINNTTGNTPTEGSSYWTLVGTSSILLGAYSGGTAYVAGNEVTYLGAIYKCILASTGNLPTDQTYWTLVGTNSLFLGAYSGGTAYVPGNQVTYLNNYYVCILVSTGNLPTNGTYWQLVNINNSLFMGAYSGSTPYLVGNQVSYSGNYYICILATTGNLPTNGTYWQQVSNTNTSEFIGAYNGATAYVIGNQVSYLGGYYICIANTTGNAPTNTSYWQQISNAEAYLGSYNGGTAYVVGQQVSYLGSFWICISATTGNAPSTTSSYWTLLGTSVILLGAWSGSTAYVAGNEVTYNGNIFRALQANTNQTPPTPPATNAYWQCIGPSTLDNLPDGTSNFSATAGTLTYRPTSNPLLSTDAGSSATVSVSSFDMQTNQKGLISYNSGSVTALSYSQIYYIWVSDPTLAGGSATYSASTTKTASLANGGYLFLGSINTPAAAGGNIIGNNDGGAGNQTALSFYQGPSAFATAIGYTGFTTPSSTGGTASATGITGSMGESWFGFGSGINLSASTPTKILSIESSWIISSGTWNYVLEYSLNSGSTWNVIVNTSSGRALTTDTVTLPPGQDIATVQVQAQANYNSGGSGAHATLIVSGIRIISSS